MSEKQDKKLGALEHKNVVHAAGAYSGAAQTWAAEMVLTRSATGTVTATLDREADSAECACIATVRGATTALIVVEQTSDAVKTVKTYVGTTLTDIGFDLLIIRKPGT